MIIVTYKEPVKTTRDDLWLIGWNHVGREKCKASEFVRGDYEKACTVINSRKGAKYNYQGKIPYKV